MVLSHNYFNAVLCVCLRLLTDLCMLQERKLSRAPFHVPFLRILLFDSELQDEVGFGKVIFGNALNGAFGGALNVAFDSF